VKGLAFGLLASVAAVHASAFAQGDIQTGLVAYYDCDALEGSVLPDQTANGYDATVNGSVPLAASMTGFGMALDFSGTSTDYVSSDSLPHIDIDPGTFSHGCWANAAFISSPEYGWVGVITRSGNACLKYDNDWVKYVFQFYLDDSGTDVERKIFETPTGVDGIWTHVTVTFDKAASLAAIYVNGSLAGEDDWSVTAYAGLPLKDFWDGPWVFGNHDVGNPMAWKGLMDEIRFYNRALSVDDVAALYAHEPSAPGTPTATIEVTTHASEPSTDGAFTVNLTTAPASDITVNYTVGGGSTATSGVDFTALTGTVVVRSGATSAVIAVEVRDDTDEEGPETLVVGLADGTGYVLGASTTATMDIGDDDFAPAAFGLTAPSDGSSVPCDQDLDFTWEASSGAISYTFELARDSSFADVRVTQTVYQPSCSVSSDDLSPTTQYWWRVTAVNAIDSTTCNAAFDFTTEADNTPPQVSYTNPSAQKNNVAVDTAVSIIFSEAIDAGTIDGSVTMAVVGGVTVSGDVVQVSARVIKFTPDEELDYATDYVVTVLTVITDTSGNHLASPHEFEFTTQDALAGLAFGPGCVAGSPLAGAAWAVLFVAAAFVLLRRRGEARS
jgi:hypothetical protein